jgi:CheY-like chemotaxis protein
MAGTGGARPEGAGDPVGADQHEPTVLLVEDDDNARFAMAALLAHEGYQVLTAATAHDALGVLRTPSSPIDVVLLDVPLPDASGLDICARLGELHPGTPVIVCTGEATPEEAAAAWGSPCSMADRMRVTSLIGTPARLAGPAPSVRPAVLGGRWNGDGPRPSPRPPARA